MKRFMRGIWFALNAFGIGVISSVLVAALIWAACRLGIAAQELGVTVYWIFKMWG